MKYVGTDYSHICSALALRRQRTLLWYNSNPFQYATAGLIIIGFMIDIIEAQIMPVDGSNEVCVFTTGYATMFTTRYVIIIGFMIDIIEAQIMPVDGSNEVCVFTTRCTAMFTTRYVTAGLFFFYLVFDMTLSGFFT